MKTYKQEIICSNCKRVVSTKEVSKWGKTINEEKKEIYYTVVRSEDNDWFPSVYLCEECWDIARIHLGLGWD